MANIIVCTTCRVPQKRDSGDGGDPCGEGLLAAVSVAAADVPGLTVTGHACLMGCEHGCNVALTAPGKLSYMLGRFAPSPGDAAALVAYAALYAASDTGVVPYRQWPQGVKGHFIARIPPLP